MQTQYQEVCLISGELAEKVKSITDSRGVSAGIGYILSLFPNTNTGKFFNCKPRTKGDEYYFKDFLMIIPKKLNFVWLSKIIIN